MLYAIILAGGKGTRLAERLEGKPKPLVNIAGIPLLERQLLALKEHGIGDVMVLVNHKAEVIADFCNGKNNFGLNIKLVDDGEPRGTAGAVLAALPQLPQNTTALIVLYGDTLFNVDMHRLVDFHKKHEADATLFLHPNDHPHDSDLVEIDEHDRIKAIHPYPHPQGAEYANLVNAAMYIVNRKALTPWEYIANEPARIVDFAKELFPRMVEAGQHLYGYNSPEYIKDVGTPARLDKAEKDIASGRFENGSLRTPKAAVFIDRDGVINKEVDHLKRKEDLELIHGTAEALRRLNQSGLISVVVTNQPVIARGECSEKELAAIHARMDTIIGREGAYIDRLYYCPHHPDKGFEGERPELKIKCNCRKPNIGMFKEAQKDLHIDFAESWMIGDRTADILAAQKIGARSILVQTGAMGLDGKYPVSPNYTADDLHSAAAFILDQHPKYMLACKKLVSDLKIKMGGTILIGGLAKSGKSTFASLLKDALKTSGISAHILCLDSFLRPQSERGITVLERYNMGQISELAQKLSKRPASILLPHYTPLKRSLVNNAIQFEIKPDDVLIIEGVVALNSPELIAIANTCFYVECETETRRERFKADYERRGEGAKWQELFEEREQEERPTIESGKKYGKLVTLELLTTS